MKERIFRAPDETLVLQGIKNVGINNAVQFGKDVYSYPKTGFPQGTPPEIRQDVFWGAINQRQKKGV